MTDPTNKTELLVKMRSSLATFEELLKPFSEEQLAEPGVNDDWSIKDILAHIATWQGRMAARLEMIARHEDATQLQPAITNEEEMNAFNAATLTTNRARSLAEVQANFHASTRQLQAAVEAAGEDDLFKPGRFAWLEGEPLWKNVGGNSFWHYEEHTPMIKEWHDRQQG